MPTAKSWPISTPTLKVSSASGKWLSGRPICFSAPAKPRPWTRPNRKATRAGRRRASVAPGFNASLATSTIDSAIDASTGAERSVNQPITLLASVRLWASVNAVMVPTRRRLKPTRNSRPITNIK